MTTVFAIPLKQNKITKLCVYTLAARFRLSDQAFSGILFVLGFSSRQTAVFCGYILLSWYLFVSLHCFLCWVALGLYNYHPFASLSHFCKSLTDDTILLCIHLPARDWLWCYHCSRTSHICKWRCKVLDAGIQLKPLAHDALQPLRWEKQQFSAHRMTCHTVLFTHLAFATDREGATISILILAAGASTSKKMVRATVDTEETTLSWRR